MTSADIAGLMDKATAALGGDGEFSLVLLNEASAFPHGSHTPQAVREGSVILMDCGCGVHGYQSDISRTWVHGKATPRQRKVWNTVKRGQEVALEAAELGAPAEPWTTRSAASTNPRAGAPATASPASPTAPATASASTATKTPTSSTTTPRPWSPACASRMSRGSTFPGSLASAWRIAGT